MRHDYLTQICFFDQCLGRLLSLLVAWLFGYSRNADGIERDRARARHAAKWLSVLADKEDEVVVIGHGIMKRLIIKQLVLSGWSRAESSHEGYWSYQGICLGAA